jgi:hypothetical protein
MRDEIAGLDELDDKLAYWGNLGWELVTLVHTTKPTDENILAAEVWMLILKQPAHTSIH